MTTEEDSQEQLENEQLDGENVATEDDDADNGGTEERKNGKARRRG